MATIIQDKQRSNEDRHQRWARIERADLFAQYGDRLLPISMREFRFALAYSHP